MCTVYCIRNIVCTYESYSWARRKILLSAWEFPECLFPLSSTRQRHRHRHRRRPPPLACWHSASQKLGASHKLTGALLLAETRRRRLLLLPSHSAAALVATVVVEGGRGRKNKNAGGHLEPIRATRLMCWNGRSQPFKLKSLLTLLRHHFTNKGQINDTSLTSALAAKGLGKEGMDLTGPPPPPPWILLPPPYGPHPCQQPSPSVILLATGSVPVTESLTPPSSERWWSSRQRQLHEATANIMYRNLKSLVSV